MKTYENLLLPVDEWFVTSTLELLDDGTFQYRETWSSYAGSTHGKAEGQWRQTHDAVVLETQVVEGSLLVGLAAGQNFRAVERADGLDFGNDFMMNRRPAQGAN